LNGSSPGRIFISYRRQETAWPAGRLYDVLVEHFPAEQVFKDVDNIEPGDDFVDRITAAVASCDVLLALIGPHWMTITNKKGQRRLDDPEDYVRIEIETALTRNIRVIPILVDEARMPGADELPPTLAALVRRNAVEINPLSFDTKRLIATVHKTLTDLKVSDAAEAHRLYDHEKSRDASNGASARGGPVGNGPLGSGPIGSGTDRKGEIPPPPSRPMRPRLRRIALVIAALIVAGTITGTWLWYSALRDRSPGGSSSAASPGESSTTADCGAINEEFDTGQLASGWGQLNDGRFVLAAGSMAITANDGADIRSDVQGAVTAPFLARTARGDFSIETVVTVDPRYSYQAAGLLLYGDRDNYVRLERGFGSRGAIAFEYAADGRHTKIHGPFSKGPRRVPTSATVVWLKLVRTGTSIRGFWHPSQSSAWQELSGTAPLAGDAKVGVTVLNRSQPPAEDPARKPLTATFSYVDINC
jgi:TIR domain/Protein of unknown function (DUF1349)